VCQTGTPAPIRLPTRRAAGIQGLLDLRTALATVPAVRDALAAANSALLCSIRDSVCSSPALAALALRIDGMLDEEVCQGKAAFLHMTQQIFAVRSGVDGFLDVGAPRLQRL
jgi:DNA mismatch repair protein MSH4